MKRRAAFILTSAATCCALASGAAAPAGAATRPTGHWGNAHQVRGLDKLNTGNSSATTAVSCTAPGDCAAAGSYSANHADHVFATGEKDGVWGKAVPVPLPDPAATESGINAMACAAPGDCFAAGIFNIAVGSPGKGFIATEENGTWDSSMSVSGGTTASDVIAISCAHTDGCAGGGFIIGGPGQASAPFIINEQNGMWGPVQAVQGLAALGATAATVRAISCPSTGNCAATGSFTDRSGTQQTFVVDEKNGTWGNAQPVPEMSMLKASSSFPTGISCGAPGDCAVGGTYTDDMRKEQVFIATEVNGAWGTPQQVPGTGALNAQGIARIDAVSCRAGGNCAVAGYFTDRDGRRHAFTDDEKNGTWQAVRTPAGTGPDSEATSASCTSRGNCVAVGAARFGDATQAFTVSEVDGTWGKAHALPGIAALNTGHLVEGTVVSCATTGNCAAGGVYVDAHSNVHAFLADESTATMTSLKLSAATVKFGHEQSEKLSATVKPRTGGTPSGTVTILAGATTLCVIKLAGSKGSCTLAAKKLKPGRYQLTGSYRGDRTYDGSAYPSQILTVTK